MEFRPDFVEGFNILGNTFHQKMQYAEAIKYYKVAIEKDPKLADAYSNLGLAYQDVERVKEALECF